MYFIRHHLWKIFNMCGYYLAYERSILFYYINFIIYMCLHRYLVTHLMGADLNNIVRTQKLSDDHVQFLVYQILRGLKYIHSAGIIHRV